MQEIANLHRDDIAPPRNVCAPDIAVAPNTCDLLQSDPELADGLFLHAQAARYLASLTPGESIRCYAPCMMSESGEDQITATEPRKNAQFST